MTEPEMCSFTVDRRGKVVVLRLGGALDVAAFPELRRRLAAISVTKAPVVVLDLSGVDFLDSACLGALLREYMAYRDTGRDLRFAGRHSAIMRPLALMGVTAAIVVHDTVEDALAQHGEAASASG
ncbi:STAS domain-containing protein [Allokutzneria albata]|uniref:Anti-sigma factor antagonist n=1 Tax=Allokutzneria albata TaxID=211114 RepID=A0A1G9SHC7_ALLAB|nr:STAS domain-containing protein [Allokutzneria albata]SDM34898.1 stage II sporulation protein AA (anti-sigma F factor antagonist) [Allokutzneria albata]